MPPHCISLTSLLLLHTNTSVHTHTPVNGKPLSAFLNVYQPTGSCCWGFSLWPFSVLPPPPDHQGNGGNQTGHFINVQRLKASVNVRLVWLQSPRNHISGSLLTCTLYVWEFVSLWGVWAISRGIVGPHVSRHIIETLWSHPVPGIRGDGRRGVQLETMSGEWKFSEQPALGVLQQVLNNCDITCKEQQ